MKKDRQRIWHVAALASSLGWELALPIFGGVLGGHFLDRWLGTEYVLTVGLLLFGVFAGFYNVMRTVRRVEAHERGYAAREEGDGGD
ncbi:MAG: AtpZ/AtpI family protein [Chloroflexota bacterium]|nr:AtpZ/AtpI family protein [Chloroflexota bacterium]